MDHLAVLLVVIPLSGAFFVPVFGRQGGRGYRIALGTVLLTTGCAAALLIITARGQAISYLVGDWPPPWGVELRVDAFSAFLSFFFSLIYVAVIAFSARDVPHDLNPAALRWYWSLMLLLLAGLLGVASAADLFNLFVFTEIYSLAACGIISVRDRMDSLEAALKYLLLSAVAAGCILLGISLIYMVTGHLNYAYLATALPDVAAGYPRTVLAAVALLATGYGMKSALFPLHIWLPDAHSSALSPASAVLSGLAVKAGIIALFRLFASVLSASPAVVRAMPAFLGVLAVGGMIFGALFAMTQTDLKRMLAYSTVVQIGYIYLAFSVLNPVALTGAILHIVNHALLKGMLFLSAGLIIHRTGKRRIADLHGIARQMPLTMIAFTIGAMGMVGIPLTNGFVSKWYMVLGTLEAGQPLAAVVILLSSLLSALYYFPLVIAGWFGSPPAPGQARPEGPPSMLWPVLGMGAACLILGVIPGPVISVLGEAARVLLGR
ncbi:MAG TPA: monovalent cation/H+ antiporter subunit D family protein [Clostridiales bacterium]|nr:monovalent cation/H+ antiporter subunit D family protein [Clostridiales bacterium]